jgi:predicted DCC family thiol-disulfide oxidoreductase YuxK
VNGDRVGAQAASPPEPHRGGPGPCQGPGNNDVIFYDGVCGFCDRLVQFVLARDARAHFRFAQLQGTLARRELPPRGGQPEDLDTVCVLTGDGRLLVQSRAVLYVMRRLGGGWAPLSAVLQVVPRFLADVVYRLVARVRYRIWGRFDRCRVPTAAERGRFIAGP